mmetsp:Transcript_17061/g.59716  ORF Transcript_17061/g.59716 Transcript_17061/m.59716 type:complete len:260 (+) Transcript_17061:587-1366(+)
MRGAEAAPPDQASAATFGRNRHSFAPQSWACTVSTPGRMSSTCSGLPGRGAAPASPKNTQTAPVGLAPSGSMPAGGLMSLSVPGKAPSKSSAQLPSSTKLAYQGSFVSASAATPWAPPEKRRCVDAEEGVAPEVSSVQPPSTASARRLKKRLRAKRTAGPSSPVASASRSSPPSPRSPPGTLAALPRRCSKRHVDANGAASSSEPLRPPGSAASSALGTPSKHGGGAAGAVDATAAGGSGSAVRGWAMAGGCGKEASSS